MRCAPRRYAKHQLGKVICEGIVRDFRGQFVSVLVDPLLEITLGDFQECLPPFAKGGQGGLKAETVLAEESKSPLTPLLQRGGLVCSFLEYALVLISSLMLHNIS